LILVSACRAAPPEAPADFGELTAFLFSDFENADAVLMTDAADNLHAYFVGIEADATSDLAAGTEREQRTWSLPILTREQMGDAEVPDVDPERQLPVAVGYRSPHPLADHAPLVALADQTPIEAESSASYDRAFDTDSGCFVDGSCDTLDCTDTIHRQNLLLNLTYWQHKQYRRLTRTDGQQVVISRSWISEQFTEEPPNSDTIEQWTGVSANLEDSDTTIRYSALWGSSSLNDTLDSDYLKNQVADGMEEGFVNTDAYLDAE
jgi:hypothetical protein